MTLMSCGRALIRSGPAIGRGAGGGVGGGVGDGVGCEIRKLGAKKWNEVGF